MNAGLQTSSFGLFVRCMKRTHEEVAKAIEAFVDGTGRQWDWDGFTSIRIDDPALEAIRKKCVAMPDQFPPSKKGEYCNADGLQAMRELAQGLHKEAAGRS